MNEYTASNGVAFEWTNAGKTLLLHSPGGSWPNGEPHALMLNADFGPALREFFAAERDAELGRERDPENPDFVFYPGSNDKLDDDYVNVLNEPKGTRHGAYYRESMGQRAAFGKSYNGRDLDEYELAAIRYFVTHPKPEPKPKWESRRMDEAWVLTIEGREQVFMVDQFLDFRASNGAKLGVHSDAPVTDGYRIYPPADPS